MQPPAQKIASNHQPETMTIMRPRQSYAVVDKNAYPGPNVAQS
jgi:hypothetical protein